MANLSFDYALFRHGRISPTLENSYEQIAADFDRDRDNILFNGQPLSQLLLASEKPQPSEIDALWEQLLFGLEEGAKPYYKDFLNKTCHQGGILYILTAALYASVLHTKQNSQNLS